MKKMKQMFQNAAEENVRSIKSYVTELKERVAKLQYQKQLLVCQIYVEVEFNRLKWMQMCFAEVGDASPAPAGGESSSSLSYSLKALRQEREFLFRRLNSRTTEDERVLYPLNGKYRWRGSKGSFSL